MYLSADAILKSIHKLKAEVHPFIGITFLACKRRGLSIGSVDEFSMDALTRSHMEAHHRIDRHSEHYFQPFRGSSSWWVAKKYPSSGLQTINTQTFPSVFLHPRASQKWGFANDYLTQIDSILAERKVASRISADALAVWLYKSEDLGTLSSYEELVERFFADYHITNAEQDAIFSNRTMEEALPGTLAFTPEPLEMVSVTRHLPAPPDAEAEGGRTIATLKLTNAAPSPEMNLDFGQRLTIVTGDNGLGKSFLLDFTWWAATGMWADRDALPQQDKPNDIPSVEYALSDHSGRLSRFTATYSQKGGWVRPRNAMTIEAIGVFSRADGSFAIADPVRNRFNRNGAATGSLTAYEVWNGRPGVIEGLTRDWIRWQSASDRKTFDRFAAVLKRLSPEDLGVLVPGNPVRLPGDPRSIPTIQHRYGTVPVTHASSGVQRVLLLAYLIIWSWQEHELASEKLGASPLQRMMVIVDELEAHLHPKWQRIVLPALMSVGDILSSDVAIQTIAATHSPMILASLESSFDANTDVLYHLYGDNGTVKLEETAFIKYGDASGWLTSPLFGLRHARSREAENTIDEAKSLQMEPEPSAEAVAAVSDKLRMYLAGDDKFWPRWLYFAEQHGVKL